MLIGSSAHAASFGHSRIVSTLGQPLRIDVPVTQLSADDLRSISVAPAPAAAWVQAGLTPPVDLGSLQARVADGFSAGSKVIQVRSSQAFDRPVADLLLDVRTASGQQRFQVSLLTHASQGSLQPTQVQSQARAKAGASSTGSIAIAGSHAAQGSIAVRRGDTMFAVAKRHAVPGVTVYQMMIALQRANPQAFIEDNVNLVKAGAMLSMPDMAALTAISDREARRIFQQQSQAFALYRQRMAGQASVVGQAGAGAKGVVSSDNAAVAPQPAAGPRDQLRLSGSGPAKGSSSVNGQGSTTGGGAGAPGNASSADVQADDRVATSKGIKDSEARVSQLEENVKHLNEALQAQGAAASDLLVDGAKGLGLSLPGALRGATDTNGTNGANRDNPTNAANNASAGSNANAANGGNAANGANTPNAVGRNGQAPGGAASSAESAAAGGSNASPKPGAGAVGSSSGAAAGSGDTAKSPAAADSAAANNNANNAASNGTNAAGGVEQSISIKAGQTVSWIQEHMLGVITGLLALIVLIIAWILRRANAAHDDDDRPSPVTEAMVKEKLDKINLDFEQAPSDEPTRKG